MTNIPLVFVTEIKTSKTVSFCSVSVSAEDCGSAILMWSDITLYLFAVDRLKHMSGLGLQLIGRLTLGHIKKEEVQKMNDFPQFKTSYQGFCGYADLQVDKEHLRRVVMGNKDQQTKWNTLQGSKLLTPVMRHMSCLCIQPLSETRRGPQEIHVLRSCSSLCNSGSTLQELLL